MNLLPKNMLLKRSVFSGEGAGVAHWLQDHQHLAGDRRQEQEEKACDPDIGPIVEKVWPQALDPAAPVPAARAPAPLLLLLLPLVLLPLVLRLLLQLHLILLLRGSSSRC